MLCDTMYVAEERDVLRRCLRAESDDGPGDGIGCRRRDVPTDVATGDPLGVRRPGGLQATDEPARASTLVRTECRHPGGLDRLRRRRRRCRVGSIRGGLSRGRFRGVAGGARAKGR